VSELPDCLVDLGHSRIKWGWSRQGKLLDDGSGACAMDNLGLFVQAVQDKPGHNLWLSGQSNPEFVAKVTELADRHGLSLHPVRTGEINLPVQPAYATLGTDRWLALQWPWLQTRRAFCVVDCGTAVTVDVVNDNGRHLGGWILAGLGVLRAGLLERARGLPRQELDCGRIDQPATDSATAIARGTLLQLTAAIDRAVAAGAQAAGQPCQTWLTGGDADQVIDHLAVSACHDERLVLRGLALATAAS
jgi:type III pantothenate kinase